MTPTLQQPQLRNASLLASKATTLLASAPLQAPNTMVLSASPAPPVELAPIKTLPTEPIAETTTPVAATLPTSQPTIKTTQDSSNMGTKSGDTWFAINLPGNSTPTGTGTSGSTLTQDQKNQRGIIIGSVILVVLVLTVWAMNRKTA